MPGPPTRSDRPGFDAAAIRRYYDRNTRAFLRYGHGGGEGVIHRAVWGTGVAERREALHYVEDRIADVIRRCAAEAETPHVVDLGCGVGASLCYLAERLPIRGTGITLSPEQAELGRKRIAALGLDGRVTCREGDFTDLPPDLERADVAFAIESFVHASDPERFFAECARLVRRGGALAICDDMRGATDSAAAERTLRRFVRGWHANTLLTPEELRAMAARAGFVHVSAERLTPYLELRRPRDVAIAALIAPLGVLPWRSTRLDPLIGGTALQTGLAKGWIDYDLAVFRRV
ncbi:SAM-dependent methyltransferase [Microbacterium immunditiarum]|uniref:SAM-dependent methyltransferase n=1 Tax=Microbacterium immunditiarum TaxID=337480 RepID=A0A7Y9GPX5_9MICO|nr:class I SAM-dependent methyltransferase [Microbacterium immunditiarum]NYE20461.1 SAM-dependent methyltransferase [Microbacterium immunditiarum]